MEESRGNALVRGAGTIKQLQPPPPIPEGRWCGRIEAMQDEGLLGLAIKLKQRGSAAPVYGTLLLPFAVRWPLVPHWPLLQGRAVGHGMRDALLWCRRWPAHTSATPS